MGCDFYISTYLKLCTSKGDFETRLEVRQKWYNSNNKNSQKKQMEELSKEFTIYENCNYILNSDCNYNDEYSDIVNNFIEQLNNKISNNFYAENDEENCEQMLINFNDIIKIVICSSSHERS